MSDFGVAVLGAGGIIAPAIVRDLAESEEVASLLLLDLDGARAARGRRRARRRAAPASRAVAIDARDGAALRRARGLRRARQRRELPPEPRRDGGLRSRAGCHYIDLGGLYWMTARQLELHDALRARPGCSRCSGSGSSPGKTNVMAARGGARAARRRAVASIHVAAAGRDPSAARGCALPYALRTLLDELTMAPVVLDDGEPARARAARARAASCASPSRSATRDDPHAALRAADLRLELRRAARRASGCRSRPRCSSACEALRDAAEDEVAAAQAAAGAAVGAAPSRGTWSSSSAPTARGAR